MSFYRQEIFDTDSIRYFKNHPGLDAIHFYDKHFEELRDGNFDNLDKEEIRYLLEKAAVGDIHSLNNYTERFIWATLWFIIIIGKNRSDKLRWTPEYAIFMDEFLIGIRSYIKTINNFSDDLKKEILNERNLLKWVNALNDEFNVYIKTVLIDEIDNDILDDVWKIFSDDAIFDEIKFFKNLNDFITEELPKHKIETIIEILKEKKGQ